MDPDARLLCEMIRLAKLTEQMASRGVEFEISLFRSGEEFMSCFESGRFDLIFMDVYMDGMNGVETARAIRERDERAEIAFTTTSPDHALDSYGVGAIQYLLKPLQREAIDALLRRLFNRIEKTNLEVCSVTVDRLRRDIPLRDIMYAESDVKHCRIHTTTEVLTLACSIKSLESQLRPPSFLRCHRSYIVNFGYVREISSGDFKMKNGDKVYIRKGNVRACTDAYKAWLIDSAWREIK
jgi:DNA-binding LytR/AlgR family response regulator